MLARDLYQPAVIEMRTVRFKNSAQLYYTIYSIYSIYYTM